MRIQLFLIATLSFMSSCDNNHETQPSCTEFGECDTCIIIDKNLFNTTNTNNYNIQNIEVSEDCLEISFSSSGCDGNSWEVALVDLDAVSETTIPQRELKLNLENKEACEAYITKTISFNLKPLQLKNYNQIKLKIENYSSLITYEY
ncbi:hypothetical protein RBH94_11450 [Aestuariibaculum sp. YM273]|uniref:hypothetical protein n=1 Tax=Aestuariibaculum sp. YM273 TaxID=3070659 RepID=UPI0027DE085D|nr:hypothetical protein [Aestuariibaculum sp. YM273]WMI64673.1 hypothetical protein RBH94_11450 [Aestuariibaculum sp. YM273]